VPEVDLVDLLFALADLLLHPADLLKDLPRVTLLRKVALISRQVPHQLDLVRLSLSCGDLELVNFFLEQLGLLAKFAALNFELH